MLTYPIVDRRDSRRAPLARFVRLRDAHLPYRLGSVTVGSKLGPDRLSHRRLDRQIERMIQRLFTKATR